jgi:hypothetical protein
MPELESQFYNAGFFLIEGAKRTEWMSAEILPEMIYSLSGCICNLHPPMELIPWVKGDSIDDYQKRLELPDREFLELMLRFEKLFDAQKFGWNSVFFEVEVAKDFAKTHLQKIQDLKLYQALVPMKLVETILKETESEAFEPHGLRTIILKKEIAKTNLNTMLGFEIIGYDLNHFHSFVCNSLENDFCNKLNISLNSNGYISDFEEAIRATEYCNLESTGAEDGFLFPVGIREISLDVVIS